MRVSLPYTNPEFGDTERPAVMEADEQQVDEIKESMSDDEEEDDKEAKVGRVANYV